MGDHTEQYYRIGKKYVRQQLAKVLTESRSEVTASGIIQALDHVAEEMGLEKKTVVRTYYTSNEEE